MPVWLGRLRRCRSFKGIMRPLPEPPESPEPLVALAKELSHVEARAPRQEVHAHACAGRCEAPPCQAGRHGLEDELRVLQTLHS